MTDAELERIVGATIARDLNHTQRATVEHAITENAAGVERLAAEVIADPKVRRATPTLCARIQRGQHLRYQQRATAQHADQLDTARRLYAAKLAAIGDQAIAIDYAVEHASRLHSSPLDPDEIETQLRLEIGAEPLQPPADHATQLAWMQHLASSTTTPDLP